MKKVYKYALVLIMVFVLLLSSCGKSDTNNATVTNPHNTDKTFTVAIVQYNDTYTFSEMRKAFISRMRTLGYDESKMKFDIKNAQGNPDELTRIAESLVNSQYNLIVPIATEAAVAVSKTNNTIPSVFIGVTDPVGSELTSNLKSPDKNMTGTVYKTSPDDLFVLSGILVPNVKKVGVIYNIDHIATELTLSDAEKYLQNNGFTFEEKSLDSTSDINAVVTDILSRNDAIFIPQDTTIESHIDDIISIAKANHKFVFASSDTAVKAGALVAVCTPVETLSKESAQLADKILQGNKISTLAIIDSIEQTKFISKTTTALMGVQVPNLENSKIV